MELPRCMKICGRFVWLILWWAQLGVFCFYVHLCWDSSVLASIVFAWFLVSCILRLVLGPVILLFSKRKPHCDPYIWLVYTVLFIVDFVLVFTLVEDRLNEERSPRPVIFEAVLCITPLLLLLLLNTADDNDVKRLGDFKWLCASMTLQVFDAIEMIDIVVSEKGKGSEINKVYEIGMIALACTSLLLSALQLVHSVHYKSTGALRNGEKIRLGLVITAAIINFVSMIIRVVVLVEYGTNETIFIAKNIISILRSTREICSFTDTYQSCPDEIQLGSEAASSDSDSDEEELFEKNFDT